MSSTTPLIETTPANTPATSASHPSFTRLDVAMLASLALSIACDALAAIFHAGWVSSAVITLLTAALLVAYALRRAWRPLLARLLVFGLIAGLLEVGTDAAGEHVVHSLSYPAQPMLWDSPVTMPLSWMVVLAQIGYLAWRLRSQRPDGLRLPLRAASALLFVWGALNIPLYEELAYYANWWRYAAAPHIGHTPLYVLLFEGLVCAALPWLLADVTRRSWRAVALRALILGAWTPCAALIAWLIIGR